MRRPREARNEALDVRPHAPEALMRRPLRRQPAEGGAVEVVSRSKPRLVLLEEPTQGVDVGAREQVFAEIRKVVGRRRRHRLRQFDHEQLAAICDRVLVLNRGHRSSPASAGDQILKSAIAEACYITAETAGRRPQ